MLGGADRTSTAVARAVPWNLLVVATIFLAIATAVAPFTGLVPVAIASLLWPFSLAFFAFRSLKAGAPKSIGFILFVVSACIGTVRVSALGIIQLATGREALFWSVDWRYHATQAFGISRFGGLSDSLDYAGAPVVYHAGPSWIAGALHALLGVPVSVSLFLIIPLCCVPIIGIALFRLAIRLGIPRQATFLALAVIFCLPGAPALFLRALARGEWSVMLESQQLWLSPAIMLNSLLALTVGLVAAAALFERISLKMSVLAVIGLATLTALKPQYLIGIGFALGPVCLYQRLRKEGLASLPELLLLAICGAVSALIALQATPQAAIFGEIQLRFPSIAQAIGQTSFYLVPSLAIVAAALAWWSRRGSLHQHSPLAENAMIASTGTFVLFLLLASTTFLIRTDLIAQVHATGLPFSRASQDINLDQALFPAGLVLLLFSLGSMVLLSSKVRFPGSGVRSSFPVGRWVAFLAIVAVLPSMIAGFVASTGSSTYSPTDEKNLLAIFQSVPVERGLWISSDLADSGDDFSRPLRAVSLTSLSEAQFLLSNVAYIGWTRLDVVPRLASIRRFFQTPWSTWHEDYLRREGIRYVLVRDRCPPAWRPSDFSGSVTMRRGDWTLLSVDWTDRAGVATWPEGSRSPRYGRAACLSGEQLR